MRRRETRVKGDGKQERREIGGERSRHKIEKREGSREKGGEI